jgi:hypothetical protein
MHWPLHGKNPLLHAIPHTPALQAAAPFVGTLHALPQPPQLPASELGSIQRLLQRNRPVSHVVWQLPREHT